MIPKKIPVPRSKAIKPLEESSSIKGNNKKTNKFINKIYDFKNTQSMTSYNTEL